MKINLFLWSFSNSGDDDEYRKLILHIKSIYFQRFIDYLSQLIFVGLKSLKPLIRFFVYKINLLLAVFNFTSFGKQLIEQTILVVKTNWENLRCNPNSRNSDRHSTVP